MFIKHAAVLWPFMSTKQEIRWRPKEKETKAFEAIRDLAGQQMLRNHYQDDDAGRSDGECDLSDSDAHGEEVGHD